MAYAPLGALFLHPKLKERIYRDESCYVYEPGTTTAVTVYADAAGSATITQPAPFVKTRDALLGFVEPGFYDLFAGGKRVPVEVPSASAPNHLRNYALGVSTLPGGYFDCNTDNLALTSGTVIFTKLEPVSAAMPVDTISLIVGQTESGTETDQRVGLYSSDGTTMTRIGLSATSTTMLETDDTLVASALASGPFTITPGIDYYAAVISVATTPGTLVGFSPVGIGAATPPPSALEHPAPSYTLGSQTALDATEAISGMTASWVVPFMFAYDAA